MARNIVNEPCTLVYTLLDTNVLSFDDFSLIVRSLHSYMVESIVPHPEENNVHVKLSYQASIANATAKLGTLQDCVSVTKLSSYIKDSEISHLEQLKRQFNIGFGEASTSGPLRKQTTKRQQRKIMPYKRQYQQRPPQKDIESVYDEECDDDLYTQTVD